MSADLFAAEAVHVTRRFGSFRILVTRRAAAGAVPADIIVLTRGEVRGADPALCRVASACVTSSALDSAECDCDLQNAAALSRIDDADHGLLLYLSHQEGRGHGLQMKVRALRNKNAGLDTFAAVETLGAPPDVRSYAAVPIILDALGVRSVTLLGGSPRKHHALLDCGVKVASTEPLSVTPHSHSMSSMRAKHARGHLTIGAYADDPSLPYP